MKNDGYCTLQEYNEMKISIFDAIDEWQKYWNSDVATGIAINPTTHSVEVMKKEETTAPLEWWCITDLLDDEGETDGSEVLTLVDEYCFLR